MKTALSPCLAVASRWRQRWALAAGGLCLAFATGHCAAALSTEESKALADPSTATATAIRLGKEGRADFLDFPGARRNAKLIDAWRKGLAESIVAGGRGLELEKETLAIENAVLAAARSAAGDERVTESLAAVFDVVRYRTRPTFDWLRGRITSIPWPADHRYVTLLNTANPAHAEPIFDMRRSIPLTARPAFLAALGRLKYQPALPFLEELLAGYPEGFVSTGQVAQTILAIDDRFPPPALLVRIQQSRNPDASQQERDRAAGLVGVLVDHNGKTPLDYKALRAALPETIPASAQAQWVRLLRKHRPAEGHVDLLAIAATGGPGAENAGQAIADVPDAELWRRGVEALRKGQANAPGDRSLANAIARLESLLAKPDESVAQTQSMRARDEFSARTSAITLRMTAIIAKPSVAAGDADEITSLLAKYGSLMEEDSNEARAHAQTARGWRYKAAQWLRLAAGRPQEAMTHFDALAKEGKLEAAIAAADTLQFDLGRPKEALARFEQVLAAWMGSKRMPYVLFNEVLEEKWLREWLSAEINYLRSGKRYAATIRRPNAERAAQVIRILDFDMPESWHGIRGAPDPSKLRRAVDSLRIARPTRFALGQLTGVLLLPTTGDISTVMMRHDPAGFLSAHFAAAVLVDQEATRNPGTRRLSHSGTTGSPEERQASAGATAKGLTKATGVAFALALDPAFASPESTWNQFTNALRKGDASRATACISEYALDDSRVPKIRTMPARELRAMADQAMSIRRVKGQDFYAEYSLISKDGKETPLVFRLEFGEWKITRLTP